MPEDQDQQLSEKGRAALHWAKLGVQIFPVQNGTKDEFLAGGWKAVATNDPAQVEHWWTQNPDANIGCNLFKSGLVAVDADVYKPECEFNAFMQGRSLPVTLTQKSARGGYHLIFRAEDGAKYPGKLCEGTEIKHDGYIMLAPSTFAGGTYTVENWAEPAPCPEWVAQRQASTFDPHTPLTPINDPNPAPPITDERLVELICGSPANADHFNCKNVVDWSESYFPVLSALCLFSSDEAQVRRVVMASPLVQNSPPKGSETRAQKVERLWATEYPRAARKGAHERQQAAQTAAHGAQFVAGLRQPVDLFGVLQPTPLPEGVLPKGIDYLAGVMAAEMGCDPAGVAVAMLGAAAGVIPDRVGVKVKDNWRERSCIWPMLVGSPTTKKSPMIRAAKAPIVKEDLRRFKAWKQADAAWLALDKEGQKANPRPVMSRLILGEATTEAAQEALRANPNGLFHPTEEASGWLASMERNGKASGLDRSFWLQAYDGGEFAYDRIGRGSVVIENLSIGLLGAIQPEKIRDAVNNAADDGLIQRTIPIILRPATMSAEERDDGTQLKNAELYAEIIKECATFDFGLTSIPLSPGAKIVRRRVERRVHEMQSLEIISRKLASHIGKYEGLFARLCLIFHILDYASAKVAKQETTFQELFQISENCALRVERFIFEFLLPHAASFYQNVVGGLDDKDALESIANYILAHRLPEIDARTVYRGDRSLRKLSNFQIAPLFEQLTALGWIEPVEGPQRRSSKHVVNPQVHILFAQRAQVEADRREKAKVAMSAIFGAAASRDNGDKT